jgi:tight adherence protein B
VNTPLAVAAVALVGLGLFVAVYFGLRQPAAAMDNPVLGRLERYIDPDGPMERPAGSGLQELLTRTRRRIAERDESARGQSAARDALGDQLSRADLDIRPTEWRIIQLAAALVLFAIFALRVNPIVGLVVGIVAPYLGGRFALGYRERRRVRKFDNQLGDVILLLSNALKAGYSFPQALATVASAAEPPISEEFSRTSRELQLGVPVDDALRRIVERNSSEDLDLLMTAVQIQRVVGGNLAEILDTIAHTIRERVRIKGEIRTLTAQARVSGWIISLLPIALAAILSVIAPDYFTPMFKQTGGLIMLGVGLVSMGIGIMIIRRIVRIKI